MNGPGDSTFTRTFHDAHSCAMLFVRFTSAAFDAPYAHTPVTARVRRHRGDVDDAAAALIAHDRSDALAVRSGPSTLTEKILRQTSESSSLDGHAASG